MKQLYAIGIIALLLVAALFAGCSSAKDTSNATSTTTTGTSATTGQSATADQSAGSDFTPVTTEDTEIGEMI